MAILNIETVFGHFGPLRLQKDMCRELAREFSFFSYLGTSWHTETTKRHDVPLKNFGTAKYEGDILLELRPEMCLSQGSVGRLTPR